MALVVSEAIVLHAFDYLESSRIVRLVTRDAGVRSAIAKGARRSHRRFGSGLDLFGQGTAFLHSKPGRDLDTLSGFDDVRTRTSLGSDLERFAGAATIAEIALRFGKDGADAELFDAVVAALDGISLSENDAREATLAGAWRIVTALGFGPTTHECAECDAPMGPMASAQFTHSAGGVLCTSCAAMSPGGRKLPWNARADIAAWMDGGHSNTLVDDFTTRAHQRLLREYLDYHLHDGRTLRAFDIWEGSQLTGPTPDVRRPTPDSDVRRPTSDVQSAITPEPSVLPAHTLPTE